MTISSRTSDHFLPQVRYRDVEGSARWLCHVLGFSVHSAVRDPEGVMDYVHLTHGPANVIIKSLVESDENETPVGETGQSHYIYVGDVTHHFATAQAEGAEIVIDLQEMPHLGRGYSCRDAEGLIWSFGSFDPWRLGLTRSAPTPVPTVQHENVSLVVAEAEPHAEPAPAVQALPAPHVRRTHRQATPRSLVIATVVGGLVGAIVVGAMLYDYGNKPSVAHEIATERTRREQSEAATRRAQEALIGERSAKEQFERAAKLIESELATVESEKAQTEAKMREAQSELTAQTGALAQAQIAAASLQDKLSESEKQWQAVEQSLAEQLDKARATAAGAQSERAAIEATLTQRVFSLEANLREEQTSRKSAEAARAATSAELLEVRNGRRQAETSLQSALANLKAERQARVEAEERADKLRGQLSARRAPAVRKVARAKAQARPAAVVKAKAAPAPKLKTSSADSVGDIGFQP